MPTRDALELAMDRGMDLIEVAPTARPPVCRVGDYGRLKYDRKKREAEARKNRSTVQLKEIKVRPKTDGHDMAFKIKNAMRFLGEGNKVKITVRFRGPSMLIMTSAPSSACGFSMRSKSTPWSKCGRVWKAGK
jgi:translation initiation factor IF-3